MGCCRWISRIEGFHVILDHFFQFAFHGEFPRRFPAGRGFGGAFG